MQQAEAATNLFGFDRAELEQLAQELGEARYRGRQIFQGIYGAAPQSLENLTSLSRSFRQKLASQFTAAFPLVRQKIASRDGAVRYLLEFSDGQAAESVYMPERDRVTLCISSQVGCAVDCAFCFTAMMGLKRNMTAGEILGQVYAIAEDQRLDSRRRLNIVFMGMGEPLLNFLPVMKTVKLLADPDGMAMPLRRITISTSGIIPRIRDLAAEPLRPKLAISLNASTDEQRSALMPLNRKYPLADLLAACRDYPLRPRERLTFEYVLLDGVNDSPEDAWRVASFVSGLRAKVNLIPYNSGAGLAFKPPPFERVLAFQEILAARQIPAFIRISRGQDIRAACGQLTLQSSQFN